jgi:ADP-ribosylglycohydrolase
LSQLSISGNDFRDKIEGYFVGQCVGNFMGLPFELSYNREMMPIEPQTYYDSSNAGDLRLRNGNVMNRVSELDGAFADDDTDIEFALLHGVEEFGLDMTYSQLATVWKRYINNWIWVSNREARNLMDRGFEPPATGMPENNRFWWAIDPQLVNEIWSAFYPGMLEKAVAKAEWSARVTSSDWGLHPTMFYAALYSAAFFVSDVERLYDIAASYVPAGSPYLEGLQDIRAWHAAFSDWRAAWARMTDKYSSNLFIDGVSAMINGLCGALAFLYGEGDFKKSLGIAIAAGFDNDNQAATLGGLLGVMHGSGKIPRDLTHEFRGHRWDMPFNNRYINDRRDSLPYENRIADIVDRIMAISRKAITSHGGYESETGLALQVNVSAFLLPGVAAPTLQTSTVDTSRVRLPSGMACFHVQSRESCCMSIDGRDERWHGGQNCIPSKQGSTFSGGWICEPADHVQFTGQQSQADTCTA